MQTGQEKENDARSDVCQEDERLARALKTLEEYVYDLAEKAGESREYAEDLWNRIRRSGGVLQELAYYHDNGQFWAQHQVAGYRLTDILVWQVDHFKAYLDRREEVNRWHPERLFLHSLDVMLRMEKDPEPFVKKMQGETGTDFVGKFWEY